MDPFFICYQYFCDGILFLLCFGRIFLTFSFAGLRDHLTPFLFSVGHFLINLSIFLWDLVSICYLSHLI